MSSNRNRLVDGLPPGPGRPRKYDDPAEALAARAVARRNAERDAAARGLVRATVLVPAGQLKNIKAIAKSMRDAADAAWRQAGIDRKKPQKEQRLAGPAFGAAEQAIVLRIWREGGTLDDLKAAGINVDQACVWLGLKGESGSAEEAYRTFAHETERARLLAGRDKRIAAGRAASAAVLASIDLGEKKPPRSAIELLREIDDPDNGGDGDDDEGLW